MAEWDTQKPVGLHRFQIIGMSLKSFAAKIFAKNVAKKTLKWVDNPIETQNSVFKEILQRAAHTKFGQDHGFSEIQSHEDFVKKVPIRDYEALKDYVNEVVEGKENILWPGKPLYFAKTSGTTSGFGTGNGPASSATGSGASP